MPSPTLSKAGVEAAREAAREGCGLTVEGKHVFCDDPVIGDLTDGYGKPLRQTVCDCKANADRIVAAYLAAAQTTEAPVPVEWRHETRLRKWADWLKDQAIEGAGFGTVPRLCDDLNEIATEMDRLRAAPSYAGEGVVVRELEWKYDDFQSLWSARSILGEYQAWCIAGHPCIREPGAREGRNVPGSTEDDAKAFVQAHFDAAIRSALAPAIASPRGADAAIAEYQFLGSLQVGIYDCIGLDHEKLAIAKRLRAKGYVTIADSAQGPMIGLTEEGAIAALDRFDAYLTALAPLNSPTQRTLT